jgi:hypothetical protein
MAGTNNAKGIRVHFHQSDSAWLCKVEGDKKKVSATLNLSHPRTKELRRDPSRLTDIILMHVIAFDQHTERLQMEFSFTKDEQEELPLKDRFEQAVGEILRRKTSEDSKEGSGSNAKDSTSPES